MPSTQEQMKASEVLERAAALIEPEGAWTQRRLYHGEACCALGAIARAGDGSLGDETNYVAEYLRRTVDRSAIGTWNDEPSRTQAEVVTALRQAADLARKEGN